MPRNKRGSKRPTLQIQSKHLLITIVFCGGLATLPAAAQCPLGGFDLTELERGLHITASGHAVADFNEDGYPDWLYGIYAGQASYLYLYAGRPGSLPDFENPLLFLLNPWLADQLYAADFNHDGHMDFVSSHQIPTYQNEVVTRIHLGNGDGTFATPQEVVTFESDNMYGGSVPGGSIPNEWFMQVADYNGDQELDLAYLSNSDTPELKVYLRQADGSFSQSFQGALTYQQWRSSYVADVNNDTYPDIIVLPYDAPGIEIHSNNGDGTFADPTFLNLSTSGLRLLGIAFGDLNGDGLSDLLLIHSTTILWEIYIQGPNGQFTLWTQGDPDDGFNT